MKFELQDRLYTLLETKKLDDAIALAESELLKIPETTFHKILGRNILHMNSELAEYISLYEQLTSLVLKKKQGLIKLIFRPRHAQRPAALYCEMNGFTINYDRWSIELYSYEKFSLNDWHWLSDDSSLNDLTITGFEDIQSVFHDLHENDRFDDPNIAEAYKVCELLVIFRLQELFREVYKTKQDSWTTIPMFVTAHDYDFIYKVN
ncbi:hypothetical protein H8B06_02010 [Sphingobacterium sp. DN00404]|uniref:Uncharacterized protein n=1 Tax=Sphingobacterium micropteri TaxID=2763501 RepID=A0ABR7YJV0_9SPHI|nr:hypothetical protein [Sphingobacterium micropteri]MBD1431585.1 hypothetical protein [Sphingobacterium micropteri]